MFDFLSSKLYFQSKNINLDLKCKNLDRIYPRGTSISIKSGKGCTI